MRHGHHHGGHRHHARRDESGSSGLLSDRDMHHLRRTLGDAHRYISSSRDASSGGHGAMRSAAIAFASIAAGVAANGYLSSRYENVFHPGGTKIPLDAVGGVAVVAAGLKWRQIPRPIVYAGAGVALGYAFKALAGLGTQQRVAQNLAPIAITAGAPAGAHSTPLLHAAPQHQPHRGLTAAEMAAYSRSF